MPREKCSKLNFEQFLITEKIWAKNIDEVNSRIKSFLILDFEKASSRAGIALFPNCDKNFSLLKTVLLSIVENTFLKPSNNVEQWYNESRGKNSCCKTQYQV